MSAERVSARLEAGVFHLTLDRPEKRNALDRALVEALLARLLEAEGSAEVRVVALRGAGPDFCAGADLAELVQSADRSPEENAADAARLGQVFEKLRQLPQPTVAVVHGRALAGGWGLALACDWVLAREDASFGFPEVRRGFVPAMVAALVRRAVGEKRAFDLLAGGESYSAHQALAWGLVSRVIPREGFEEQVARALAGLARLDPSALALTKRLFYAMDTLSFPDAIQLGARVNAVARSTPGFREAVAQFLDR